MTSNSTNEVTHIYAFVDESARNEDYYFMSAITGDYETLNRLNDELIGVINKHRVSIPHLADGFEIHAHPIMNGRKEWRNVPRRLRYAIIRDVCRAVGESGVDIFIEGIDIEKHRARGYRHMLDARELAFQWLLEKLDRHALPQDVYVDVYADQHHTAPESASKIASYRVWGTVGYRSSTLKRICHPVAFIDSQTSPLLQAADVVTYIFNRYVTIVETDPRADALKKDLWGLISKARFQSHIWP